MHKTFGSFNERKGFKTLEIVLKIHTSSGKESSFLTRNMQVLVFIFSFVFIIYMYCVPRYKV